MFSCSSGSYSSMGLDLKRHMDEHSMGSPYSSGDKSDSLQEPELKRSRQDQPKYETE